ncbi:hypothetical protein EON65_32775 [archaeon]|nr:MAG: hypothetical protein EON65_32775 [archaeon]
MRAFVVVDVASWLSKATLLYLLHIRVAMPKFIMSRRVSFVITAATLLSFPPAPIFCEGVGRDDRDKKNPANFWTSSKPIKDKPFSFSDKEFKFEDFIRSELDQGSLTPVRSMLESGVLGQLGYGFLMGYSSGFCVKKVSKIAAFMVGGAFIFIQTLSYGGLIHVDYEGLQRKVEVRIQRISALMDCVYAYMLI